MKTAAGEGGALSPAAPEYLVGSSKNMTGGLFTSSSAMARRFRWPPDRLPVRVLAQDSKPRAVRISLTCGEGGTEGSGSARHPSPPTGPTRNGHGCARQGHPRLPVPKPQALTWAPEAEKWCWGQATWAEHGPCLLLVTVPVRLAQGPGQGRRSVSTCRQGGGADPKRSGWSGVCPAQRAATVTVK